MKAAPWIKATKDGRLYVDKSNPEWQAKITRQILEIAERSKNQTMEDNIEKPSSRSIALKFAETFQNHYPAKPLIGMMEDLRKDIDSLVEAKVSDLKEENDELRKLLHDHNNMCQGKLTAQVNQFLTEIKELEEWKKQMLIIWSPLMDWMQSSSSMKVGQSISVEALKRCQEYEKQLVEISKLKEEIERLKSGISSK